MTEQPFEFGVWLAVLTVAAFPAVIGYLEDHNLFMYLLSVLFVVAAFLRDQQLRHHRRKRGD